MKKLSFFAIFLIIATFISFNFIKISANGVSIEMENGASIRTSGVQGLKYTAILPVGHDNAEHGFYIIYGTATVENLESAIANGTNVINGKAYKKQALSGFNAETRKFSVVLTGIPETGYGQLITILAYIKINGNEVYSSSVVTRNVADVARTIYNLQPAEYSGEAKTTIDSIVNPRRIKITHSNNSTNYYGDFSDEDFSLDNGDVIELTRGTFNGKLTVDKNNVSVYGINRDVEIKDTGERKTTTYEETDYKGNDGITLAEGVENFLVNGINFSKNRGLHLMGNNDGIKAEYCMFKVTGNYIIRDDSSNCLVSNVIISNNYFTSSASYARDIYFQGFINNIEVSNNYFNSNLTVLNDADYAIRLMKYSDGAKIDIYKNKFNKQGASYVIDIGYFIGSEGARNINNKVNVNIEDNWMTPHYLTCLLGNGIRVMYIGDNSTITIIHNNAFRTSPYFNAILLTAGNAANSTNTVSNLKVEILHNKFYAEDLAKVEQPSGRNVVDKRYTRIGLGIPSDCELSIANNYYGSLTSRTAYTINSSPSVSSSTNQKGLDTDKANSGATADGGYNSLMNQYIGTITDYLAAISSISDNIDAYWGGNEETDIINYIPSFDAEYANLFEIQNSKLVYIGNKLYFERAALENGLLIGDALPKESP